MRLLICISLCIHFPFFFFFILLIFPGSNTNKPGSISERDVSSDLCQRRCLFKKWRKKKGSYFVWCKDSQNTNANKKKGSRPPPAARGWSLTSYRCDVVWGRFMNLCQRVEDLFVFLTFFFFQLQYWYCCFLQTLHWRHGNCSLQLQHPDKNTSFNWKKIQSIIFLFYFFYSSESRTLSSSDSACGGKSQKYHGEFSPGFSYRTDMKIFGKKKKFPSSVKLVKDRRTWTRLSLKKFN